MNYRTLNIILCILLLGVIFIPTNMVGAAAAWQEIPV